jgi:hypothetical protein
VAERRNISAPLEGERIFFKVDYYDAELEKHSPDASDPGVTRRVLTIALTEEYCRMTSPYDDAPLRYQEDRTQFELCRACGAYDAPDVTGHCNYCGASLPSTWLHY